MAESMGRYNGELGEQGKQGKSLHTLMLLQIPDFLVETLMSQMN
jgi:hypothetical protein